MISRFFAKIKGYNPVEILMVLCALTLIIVSHAVQIWTLDKSFIPYDEGWFMYLQSNAVSDLVIRGHLLFRYFPILNDLFYNRTATYIIVTGGQLVLAYGFYRWVKSLNAQCNFFVVWGLVCMFTLYHLGAAVLNYTILSKAYSAYAIGFILIGIAKKNPFFYALCGFVLSFLIPLKVTSMLLAPVILSVIIIISKHRVRDIIFSIVGFLIGAIFYIFIIETPSDYFNFLYDGFDYTIKGNNDPSHNISHIIYWSNQTFWVYCQWFLMAYIICYLPKSISCIPFARRHKPIKFIITILAIPLVLSFFWTHVTPTFHIHNFTGFLINAAWVFSFVITVYIKPQLPEKNIFIIIMFFVAPFCISFGTDTVFTWVAPTEYVGLILGLYTLTTGKAKCFFRSTLLLLLILSIVSMLLPSTKSGKYESWNEDVYANQTIPLMAPALSHPIKVDSSFNDYVKFFKDNIKEGSYCLNEARQWGIVYLLNLRRLDPNFRVSFNAKLVAECIKLLNDQQQIYLLWQTVSGVDEQVNAIIKYRDTLSEHGFQVTEKVFDKFHVAIIYPHSTNSALNP